MSKVLSWMFYCDELHYQSQGIQFLQRKFLDNKTSLYTNLVKNFNKKSHFKNLLLTVRFVRPIYVMRSAASMNSAQKPHS
jgi:hypothetical protein